MARLTSTGPVTVGCTVRSYDFEGRDDCYVDGVVTAIGRNPHFPDCDRYTVRVTARVLDGVAQPCDEAEVFPPVNGTPKLFGGVCDAVVHIDPSSVMYFAMLDTEDIVPLPGCATFEQAFEQAPGNHHWIFSRDGLEKVAASIAKALGTGGAAA